MGLTNAEKGINGLRRRLIALPRSSKRGVMAGIDFAIVPIALWLAFAMRHGQALPEPLVRHAWLLIALPVVSVVCFQLCGMYRSVIRFLGVTVAMSVIKGVIAATIAFVVLTSVFQLTGISRNLFVLFPLFLLAGLSAVRLFARVWLPDPLRANRSREPVIIYGAGMAGVQLCSMLEHGGQFRVVAFVDDDPGSPGTDIRGIPVFAARRLNRLIDEHGVGQVLLALPSAARRRRQEIVESLEQLPVHVRTIPGLLDIVSGRAKVDELREVEIEDVLGRDTVPPNEELLERCISGQRLMVTGAGGSIGSELCRQILNRRPSCLILYEINEYGLYRIERELALVAGNQGMDVEIIPVLGNVLDRGRLDEILRLHQPTTIYHAAAYKHVPLVEANPVEGIRNNVFGTLTAVQAARDAGVCRFVLISTDKAVNPTNVMGASKRISELILQGLAAEAGDICMCMVRFGNVLDSSGSVVPLFRDQIRTGGPVTVTHQDIIRYFMTLPEASQLVLQAGAMCEGGDVFVLDMGKPVKIMDLARRMIRLSGLTVRDEKHLEGDIEIEITGLRPGEKLYEELLIGGNVSPSGHPMIMRARESSLDWPVLKKRLAILDSMCVNADIDGIRRQLGTLVEGYRCEAAEAEAAERRAQEADVVETT